MYEKILLRRQKWMPRDWGALAASECSGETPVAGLHERKEVGKGVQNEQARGLAVGS
ncbi:MAG: hypothetical protein LBP19_07575 [Treponema sp.]|jgi:hypothetical protein|nr:hypothetical protein [Treponema sp.]